jgi:arginyl-tRNA synthetase
MNIIEIIQQGVIKAVKSLYDSEITADQITMNNTRKEFEGDYTVVVFPFVKMARKKPEQVGEEMGRFLVEEIDQLEDFNVIKGFLNLRVADSYWLGFLEDIYPKKDFGQLPPKDQKVMVEFSSPNTNKPLHLGHIRNILLGWSTSQILEAAGYEVVKVQVVNDRGIAICKSMLAWELFGEGATPESTGVKSDHFVGEYYVLFEQKFKEEYQTWQQTAEAKAIVGEKSKEKQSEEAFFKAFKNTYFNEYSDLGKQAKAMLIQWEEGNEETVALWKKMNAWVYEGFDKTYEKLGVSFDKLYFESETYLLGRDVVQKGMDKGLFYQKEDNSVWIDLEDAKLDHKLVLRSDGTSVYITQDIGTAMQRYQDYGVDKMVYVVADEQNYHFQVLFEIMKRLEEPYADGLVPFGVRYGRSADRENEIPGRHSGGCRRPDRRSRRGGSGKF